jgi:hypothetical protein
MAAYIFDHFPAAVCAMAARCKLSIDPPRVMTMFADAVK